MHKVWTYAKRTDRRGVVPRNQFTRQAFVEGYSCGFGTAVIDHSGTCGEACEGGRGAYEAVIGFDHCGEELFEEAIVREGVDVEDAAEEVVGGVEDAVAIDDAGV